MTLVNTDIPNTPEVIQILNRLDSSPWNFYPTGSRYSEENREDSDWDFFIKEPSITGDDLIETLTKLGFREHFSTEDRETKELQSSYLADRPLTEYSDFSVSKVFRHDCGIDIQIIKPEWFEIKKKANEFLLRTELGQVFMKWFGDKSIYSQRSAWDIVMKHFRYDGHLENED